MSAADLAWRAAHDATRPRKSRAMTPEQKAERQVARAAELTAARDAWVERQVAAAPRATQQQLANIRRVLRLNQPKPAARDTA